MNEKREYKLPDTLRRLMNRHPQTGKKTTHKELALNLMESEAPSDVQK